MKIKGFISLRRNDVSLGRQKGASSLEYLMLGAVVIAILIAVIALDDGIATTIQSTLEGLFTDVQEAASGE
jgi:Flp pilus assembly pilin Flp